MNLTRRDFVSGLAACIAAGTLPRAQAANVKKPNIIFLLVDDLGWGDFGCYGDTFHQSPNVDRLAKEGLRFTNAYAGAPVCSPSRAAILTGKTPGRLHLTQWIPGHLYPHKKLLEPPTPRHLDLNIPTLAEQLKKSGYQTAAIGKWHLGGDGYLPENFGFDINVAGDFHGHPPSYFGPFQFHNLTGYSPHDYLTDVLTGKAEQFIRTAAPKGPFFLYLAEYAVHLPLQAPKSMVESFSRRNGGKDEPDPIYAAMIESVDTALGKVRRALKETGVEDNTIIFLTSDNGGVGFQSRRLHRIADNARFRAGKGFLYEGGIREPLIVYWPGVTRPGSVSDVPVIGMDFMPTILNITGASPAPTPSDGMDISPVLKGASSLDRDALYWHYPHYSDQGGTPSGAIREGDWKLIEFYEDNHLELYNLKLDPEEQYNFASSFSDRAVDLQKKLHSWRQGIDGLMPRPNPDYNPTLIGERLGPPVCGSTAVRGCVED